jgi:hypothetical protein
MQDAAAWQGYPSFMLRNHAILDANNVPITSMNFNALYTNAFVE